MKAIALERTRLGALARHTADDVTVLTNARRRLKAYEAIDAR